MTAAIIGHHSVATYLISAGVLVLTALVAALLGRRIGRRSFSQRLNSLSSRLGIEVLEDDSNIEAAFAHLEQVTGAATQAVSESSADAIRLRRSLDALPQGVVLCDENGAVIYRNNRANALMTSRFGDALAAQAVTELLEDAWDNGAAERTLELYGPPRKTLAVRASQIDDGRRPLGVIAMIDDISERRRLEEVRRDFVANVSHELKTPIGALGLLAETLISEPDRDIAQRLASRIHTEAFRVSRIIDDLLDLSRIESEEAPPRELILVGLVMAQAAERVRSSAEQRRVDIVMIEPDPPVAVLGDRRQLVSAMHALLENAVTYSYDGSAVTMTGVVEKVPVDGAAAGTAGTFATSNVLSTSSTATSSQSPNLMGAGPMDTTPPPSQAPSGTGAWDPQAGGAERPGFVVSTESGGERFAPDRNDGFHRRGSTSSQSPRECIRLSVRDRGVGIPARDLERIFERFYRVDHGRSRETGGTGLGLAIARHVAGNHQGWIEVESREGEGSTFTLVLPILSEYSSS